MRDFFKPNKKITHRDHSAAEPQPKLQFLPRAGRQPEIPPSPPFSKGGLRGISEMRFPTEYSLQNLESLQGTNAEHSEAKMAKC